MLQSGGLPEGARRKGPAVLSVRARVASATRRGVPRTGTPHMGPGGAGHRELGKRAGRASAHTSGSPVWNRANATAQWAENHRRPRVRSCRGCRCVEEWIRATRRCLLDPHGPGYPTEHRRQGQTTAADQGPPRCAFDEGAGSGWRSIVLRSGGASLSVPVACGFSIGWQALWLSSLLLDWSHMRGRARNALIRNTITGM